MNERSEGLFEMTPSSLRIGSLVVVQTIWGDEPGRITDFQFVDGFPMYQVEMDRGDTITISVARLHQ